MLIQNALPFCGLKQATDVCLHNRPAFTLTAEKKGETLRALDYDVIQTFARESQLECG
jgi:hypothetical protein